MRSVDATKNSKVEIGALQQSLRFLSYDRIIVITDEQSHDRIPAPRALAT